MNLRLIESETVSVACFVGYIILESLGETRIFKHYFYYLKSTVLEKINIISEFFSEKEKTRDFICLLIKNLN